MVSCVFPGSFDPVTSGHMNLIGRASRLFDHVTVVVMINIRKKGAIPVERRIALLRQACRVYPNVSVESWEGLLADYMRDTGEKIVIRGIRSGLEYDQEQSAASANHMLNSEFETVYLSTDPALAGVSSSAVKEIASFGGDISAFVPDAVTKEIEALLSKE